MKSWCMQDCLRKNNLLFEKNYTTAFSKVLLAVTIDFVFQSRYTRYTIVLRQVCETLGDPAIRGLVILLLDLSHVHSGMRILVMLLLDTLPMLGNVLMLCFFVFFIFGIVGVQLWAGMLRQRCFLQLPKNLTRPVE